jgi:hypothetical protein
MSKHRELIKKWKAHLKEGDSSMTMKLIRGGGFIKSEDLIFQGIFSCIVDCFSLYWQVIIKRRAHLRARRSSRVGGWLNINWRGYIRSCSLPQNF